MTATHSAGGAARQAAHSRPLELLTRFGLITYGVMHALIGWLALQIAWSGTPQEGDQSGAFQFIANKPLGKVLLVLVVIGLAAMTIWQALSAAVGHTDEQGRRRTMERVFSAARAVVYGVLAWTAVRIVIGSGTSSAQKQQNATSSLLSSTGGRWLVGLIGLGVLGFGIGMAIYGLKAAFERKLSTGRMNESTRRTTRLLGRIGYAAKGVAFAIVGILLVVAAMRQQPSRSGGLDAALRTLAAQPFGGWLLTIVALGFVAFAVFCLFQARYRKV